MSLNEYEDFVFGACLQDWKKLGVVMDKILKKFKKGSEVWLVGRGIDLKMKVHGEKAVADKGEENMPGGEIFMAPIRDSLNGWIKFDYSSVRDGKEVSDIELVFKDGRVIEAKASKNLDYLKKITKLESEDEDLPFGERLQDIMLPVFVAGVQYFYFTDTKKIVDRQLQANNYATAKANAFS